MKGFDQYAGKWGENAQLALDTFALKSTKGIPQWILNVMDWGILEEISGYPPGSYEKDPENVYRDFLLKCGGCFCDQWIPRNPLSMTHNGYDPETKRGATTGLEEIILDGIMIDSPEAVIEHLEDNMFPYLEHKALEMREGRSEKIEALIQSEVDVQEFFGLDMLKSPYKGFEAFPRLRYGKYGYTNYFMAYSLYPEVIEKDFSLQADLAVMQNKLSAQAVVEGGLPRVLRLDHDMADSRGMLVNMKSLDEIWLPHFARSIQPLLDAGIKLLWHCDGNLMDMVPRLIEAGVSGFQGFQYEDGMDYEKICKMRDRDGKSLMIWAGVSVTTTLPHGTISDVAQQLKWLVDIGPPVGLVLGASSSVLPGTNRANVKALIEGLKHYRDKDRG